MVEGLRGSPVKYNEDPVCSAIVRTCNRPEAFLSCSVPLHKSYNLQLHCMSVNFQSLDLKIDSDSSRVFFRETVFRVSQYQIGLPDLSVSHQQ